MTRKLTDRDRAMIAMHGEAAVVQLIEQAESAARTEERERAAKLVEGWHINRGGYLNLAEAIRTPAPATEAP